jgi:hypothetical protein
MNAPAQWDAIFQGYGDSADPRIRKFLSIIIAGKFALGHRDADCTAGLMFVTEVPYSVYVWAALFRDELAPPQFRAITNRLSLVDPLSWCVAALIDAIAHSNLGSIAAIRAPDLEPHVILNSLFLVVCSKSHDRGSITPFVDAVVNALPLSSPSPELIPALRAYFTRRSVRAKELSRWLLSANPLLPVPDFTPEAVLQHAMAECAAAAAPPAPIVIAAQPHWVESAPADQAAAADQRSSAARLESGAGDDDDDEALMITGGLGLLAPQKPDGRRGGPARPSSLQVDDDEALMLTGGLGLLTPRHDDRQGKRPRSVPAKVDDDEALLLTGGLGLQKPEARRQKK